VTSRAILLTFVSACALALAGCGSDTGDQAGRLPTVLADRLANRADRVAARLEAGDPCAALAEADRLRVAADAAIADGRVPAAARAPLEDAVAALAAAITCEPEPPPPVTQEADNENEEEKKEKDHSGEGGGGEEDDD
jgi:hypothetical protein